jgi:hypothetical protein
MASARFVARNKIYRTRVELSAGVPPLGGKNRLKPGLQQTNLATEEFVGTNIPEHHIGYHALLCCR